MPPPGLLAPPSVSIVVPVLDEAAGIRDVLMALADDRACGAEVIVVDGGSEDGTVELATPLADLVLKAPRGRGALPHPDPPGTGTACH